MATFGVAGCVELRCSAGLVAWAIAGAASARGCRLAVGLGDADGVVDEVSAVTGTSIAGRLLLVAVDCRLATVFSAVTAGDTLFVGSVAVGVASACVLDATVGWFVCRRGVFAGLAAATTGPFWAVEVCCRVSCETVCWLLVAGTLVTVSRCTLETCAVEFARVTGVVVDSTRAVSDGWAVAEGDMFATVVATLGRAMGDSRRLGVLRGDCVTEGEFSALGCRRATASAAGVDEGVGVG